MLGNSEVEMLTMVLGSQIRLVSIHSVLFKSWIRTDRILKYKRKHLSGYSNLAVNSQYTPNVYTILAPKVCFYDGTTRGMPVQIDF